MVLQLSRKQQPTFSASFLQTGGLPAVSPSVFIIFPHFLTVALQFSLSHHQHPQEHPSGRLTAFRFRTAPLAAAIFSLEDSFSQTIPAANLFYPTGSSHPVFCFLRDQQFKTCCLKTSRPTSHPLLLPRTAICFRT